MAKLWDTPSMVVARKYEQEIYDWIVEHPEDIKLKAVIDFRSDTYKKIKEFMYDYPYGVYLGEYRDSCKGNPNSLHEYAVWFVNKFPQWKDVFIEE